MESSVASLLEDVVVVAGVSATEVDDSCNSNNDRWGLLNAVKLPLVGSEKALEVTHSVEPTNNTCGIFMLGKRVLLWIKSMGGLAKLNTGR